MAEHLTTNAVGAWAFHRPSPTRQSDGSADPVTVRVRNLTICFRNRSRSSVWGCARQA